MKLDGQQISLESFCSAAKTQMKLQIPPATQTLISKAAESVQTLASGDAPIYGLNTGLGANLGYRLKPEEIADFQLQIIAGRATGVGALLPEKIGRGALLARIISASLGYSGISPELFGHLCKIYEAGLSPIIPEYGSIGAGDLVQNAHFGLAICGQGKFWHDGNLVDAKPLFDQLQITPPRLQAKDGMSLVNHSALSVALSAFALHDAKRSIDMIKAAAVLSYEGYGANQSIFSEDVNTLRPAPGQSEIASWFRHALEGSQAKPRRIQEALSFRTVATVMGAAEAALKTATLTWEDEANGVSDSPVILKDGMMHSTPNFHSPALALAMESVSLALASVATGSVQRMQRMMHPDLSDLPRYLSPIGEGSAGFVPTQKTAASLMAEIRQKAQPVFSDPTPVSDCVEDMATMTPTVQRNLHDRVNPFNY